MLTISSAVVIASATLAGPLDPPAGPIASTPGPEPRIAVNDVNTPGNASTVFIISQPGSYYLESNVEGAAGQSGIFIDADDVTLDLMGFTLQGAAGTFHGIFTSGGNTTIRNGTVCDWDALGVFLFSPSSGSLIENLYVSGSGSTGISTNENAIVRSCIAVGNTNAGIAARDSAVIESCVARSNGSTGISATVACVVTGCVARDNGGDGIFTNDGAIITDCSARLNGGGGIRMTDDSIVVDCTASQNQGDGIRAINQCQISGCVSWGNLNDGIEATGSCIVRDNLCNENGTGAGNDGAGILLTGDDSRLEGNSCIGNRRGIDVDGAGNVIIKNSCSDNLTNWDIAAGNALASIVVVPTNAAPVVGDSYVSGVIGARDANENMTH